MTKKILAITPNPTDGTSWYRSALPFARLCQANDDVQVIEYATNPIGWNDLINFDILFMQRPYSPEHTRIMHKAVFLGLKVWIDFDDVLWSVPKHNPTADVYHNEQIKAAIQLILAFAEESDCIVTVSTEALKIEVLFMAPNATVVVIPNAIDDKNINVDTLVYNPSKSTTIGWRGSDTHQMDLYLYRNQLEEILNRAENEPVFNSGLSMEFIGYNPWWLTYGRKLAINTPAVDMLTYYRYLMQRKWKMFFCVLEDTDLNRSKSNIYLLESFIAGALFVAPNMPEWRLPGVINYNGPSFFVDMINFAFQMEQGPAEFRYNEIREVIKEKYLLSKANELRMEVIDQLL